ncbi:MAG: DNA topoisomerase IV subunit A [Rhodothermales bacterium]
MDVVETVPLKDTAKEKYLNYALSVITSRALPDVRDGLKPVQRRILYAMYTNLRLLPESRHRKSATVVGEVMGKYHPHGDSAIYEAMVRMAQDFSLRYPLVDGQGNFGSIDGDSPAAMRYTEARLRAIAITFVEELTRNTVDFRPNFDGSLNEPIVLPAQVPNLLLNGSSGIAVGMATNIPPHNAGEILDALIALSKKPSMAVSEIMEHVQGPDFPTGGRILNTADEILKVYESGEGTISLRGEYSIGKLDDGRKGIIIESIPYGVNKSDLIEKIADHIRAGRVPQILDIRDESTDDVRIAIEIKRGADPDAAMAYLFKYTPLSARFHVNMTCLLPTDNPQVSAPRKVDLKSALRYFLNFRFEVVTRRLRHELEQIERRIHILKGFAIIFGSLDEAIRIIRASSDKQDAAQRLMHRFRIDDVQADAILETKLYRLSKLEIDDILVELEAKEKKAAEIRALLENENARRKLVRDELQGLKKTYADERRTLIAGPDSIREFSEEDYIVKENMYVIVSRDGWVKRQKSYTDVGSIRVREGDSIGWVLAGSTRATVCFFTNFGKAYTTRIDQLPNTTGYGDPVQKMFDFSDKETVVGVLSLDERVLPTPVPEQTNEPILFDNESEEESDSGPYFVAMTNSGYCARYSVESFADPSTRTGRTFMKVKGRDSVLGALVSRGDENVCLATKEGRALIFPVQQISTFKGASKGVIAVRLAKGDSVIGFTLSDAARQGLSVMTSRGRSETIRTTKFEVSNRGNKGKTVISRGGLSAVVPETIEVHLGGRSEEEDSENQEEA